MPGVASFQRELSGKVRNKALNIIGDILEDKIDYGPEFKKALLLRLAGSILPRLQEISGPDGGDIPLPLLGGLSNNERNSNQGNKDITETTEQD
jgi:hypothetical protein